MGVDDGYSSSLSILLGKLGTDKFVSLVDFNTWGYWFKRPFSVGMDGVNFITGDSVIPGHVAKWLILAALSNVLALGKTCSVEVISQFLCCLIFSDNKIHWRFWRLWLMFLLLRCLCLGFLNGDLPQSTSWLASVALKDKVIVLECIYFIFVQKYFSIFITQLS